VTRTEDPKIRRAVPDDAGEIARLHVHAWQWAYRGLIPGSYLDGLTDTIPRREAWWTAMLAEKCGEQRTWIADLGDGIVGFADTGLSRDEDSGPGMGELCAIYLDESVARQGVGKALLSYAVNDLRRRGFAGVTLWVLDTNRRARSFYEASGWTTDGAAKSDARPGFELHEVRYRVDLSAEEKGI
jgi:ribosomal protein S18 acetylase RimI-like enzyme